MPKWNKMTKVLFITNKTDLTTDFVVREVQKKRVDYYRLNTEEIGTSVFITLDISKDAYYLYDRLLGIKHDLNSFTSVYFRRPEVRRIDDEDLTDAERQFIKIEHYQTLEGIYSVLSGAYWISPVQTIRNAENKIYQQILANKIGLKVPDGIITNNAGDFETFCAGNDNACVVKSIRSGQVGIEETEKIAYTSILDDLPSKEQIKISPTYIQRNIKKQCDIRVTAVGRKLFSTAIMSQECEETQTDWRKGEHVLPYYEINLPEELEKKCLLLLDTLHLEFGAIDFILGEDGDYYFLEINPNGQWAWIECRTNYHIAAEIAKLLTET